MCLNCAQNKKYCPVCGPTKVALPIAGDVPPEEWKD